MRHLIWMLLVVASLALAGCVGDGSGSGGNGNGCHIWCEWSDACHDGAGVSLSVCIDACEQNMSGESEACRRAHDEYMACVTSGDDCVALPCEPEGDAMADICD